MRCARMQDGAMRAAFGALEPGMRDTDVAAIAQCYSQRHGSENGIYLCASAPLGTPAHIAQRHFQNRVIREGDYVMLLVEDSGPGGMYTELGRTCVVGKVPQEMKDEFAFTLEARRFTLDLLKPGTPCEDRSGTSTTPSCAATAGPRSRGSTATARATTWSSAR